MDDLYYYKSEGTITMMKPRKITSVTKYLDTPEMKRDIENYLNKEAVKGGTWLGEGSKFLGIYGTEIKKGELEMLGRGYHPRTGVKMFTMAKPKKCNNKKSDKKETTPWVYMDATLSAIKDYSVLAALDEGNEQKYLDGFNEAKELTLKDVEAGLTARKTVDKKQVYVKGLGCIIASFDHELSRPTTDKDDSSTIRPDMQMHSHNLFFKHAILDEKFVSVENFHMYDYQRVHGTNFRAHLGRVVRKMGFETVYRSDHVEEVVYKKGEETFEKVKINSFAIKGFTDEMREMFSKRKSDIEYLSKLQGFEGNSMARSFIAENFKNKKGNYSKKDLINIWKSDAKIVGLDRAKIEEMRTFNKHNPMDMSKVESRLLKRIVKVNSKTKLPMVYERLARLILAEHAQTTGIDVDFMLKKWEDNNTLTKTKAFTYVCNRDLTNVLKEEKSWKNRINVNKAQAFKAFKAAYFSNTKFEMDSFLKNPKVDMSKVKEEGDFMEVDISKVMKVQAQSPELKKNTESSPSNAVFASGGSDLTSAIESLQMQLGSLMGKLNTKMSGEELAKLRIQIESIVQQIENLKRQSKSKPQFS